MKRLLRWLLTPPTVHCICQYRAERFAHRHDVPRKGF